MISGPVPAATPLSVTPWGLLNAWRLLLHIPATCYVAQQLHTVCPALRTPRTRYALLGRSAPMNRLWRDGSKRSNRMV